MKRILFQGDSITDVGRNRENPAAAGGSGYGYPLLLKSQLEFDYPDSFECVNRGISGNRVVDLYARTQRDFINLKPDYISILIGVNDVWHGIGDNPNGVDVKKYEMVYDLLLTELREALPGMKRFVKCFFCFIDDLAYHTIDLFTFFCYTMIAFIKSEVCIQGENIE